jgi:tRNA A64-2'-O-ribosylphosphate transferase
MTPVPISNVAGLILLCSTLDLPQAVYQPSLENDPSPRSNIAYLLIATTKHTDSFQQPDTFASQFLRIESSGGKKGQMHFLQSVLPQSTAFIQAHLTKRSRVCIACDSGEDLGIGVALAALQSFFDNNGNFVNSQERGPTCMWHPNRFLAIPTNTTKLTSCRFEHGSSGLLPAIHKPTHHVQR